MTEPVTQRATAKEQFDLLYASLKYCHDSSIDSVFKVAGFLLILGGWLVTSKDARAFLASSLVIRLTAVAVVLLLAVVYTLIAIRVMRRSQLTFEQLEALGYMPVKYLREILIRRSTSIPFVLANGIISIALCLFILQLK